MYVYIVARYADLDQRLSARNGHGNVHWNVKSVVYRYAFCASDRVSYAVPLTPLLQQQQKLALRIYFAGVKLKDIKTLVNLWQTDQRHVHAEHFARGCIPIRCGQLVKSFTNVFVSFRFNRAKKLPRVNHQSTKARTYKTIQLHIVYVPYSVSDIYIYFSLVYNVQCQSCVNRSLLYIYIYIFNAFWRCLLYVARFNRVHQPIMCLFSCNWFCTSIPVISAILRF